MSISSEEGERLRSLIEEQRNAAAEHTVAARVAGSLIISARLQELLQRLSNDQIGQVLFDFVFSGMDLLSPEAVVTAEAIVRLGGASNRLLPARHDSDSFAKSYRPEEPTKREGQEHP